MRGQCTGKVARGGHRPFTVCSEAAAGALTRGNRSPYSLGRAAAPSIDPVASTPGGAWPEGRRTRWKQLDGGPLQFREARESRGNARGHAQRRESRWRLNLCTRGAPDRQVAVCSSRPRADCGSSGLDFRLVRRSNQIKQPARLLRERPYALLGRFRPHRQRPSGLHPQVISRRPRRAARHPGVPRRWPPISKTAGPSSLDRCPG